MLLTLGIQRASWRQALRGARFNSTAKSMNWVEFFKLRKQNKRMNVVASTVTAFGGALFTLERLGDVEIDIEKPIAGFDPTMVLGGVVIIGGLAGYLVGPFLGTALFNLINKAQLNTFKSMDQLFLQRVKKYRVDPSSQSFSNPVPDYYGERIYSLDGYKQWLRDCNAYRRKTQGLD